MKIKLLIVCTFLLVQQGFAQLGPGNLLVGGGFGFNAGGNSVGLGINPAAHYFISDNITVGGSIGFNTSRDEPGEDNYTRTNEFNIAPAVRYFKSFGDQLYVYGEGSIGFGTGGSTVVAGSTRASGPNTNRFGIGISPGIIYTPTERIGIDFNFNLLSFDRTSTKTEYNGAPTTKDVNNRFSFGFNSFAPSLGVYFIIGS